MQSGYKGITLVEVLIIAIVLGMLAFIVVPQYSSAATNFRLQELRSTLDDVRAQIRLYRIQHEDRTPALERFTGQLTGVTNRQGHPADQSAENSLGPYFHEIPVNPYSGGNAIGNGPPGSSDWFYDPETGQFRANHHADFFRY